MPTISVIVPVYKVEPYLCRCVDSILGQTYRDFELILVDDGSPDNCGAICDAYAAADSRIHVIHQKNGGLSAARNAGIDWAFANSESQWIAFVDSDDAINKFFLEKLLSAATMENADIATCRMQIFTTDMLQTENKMGTHDFETFSGRDACVHLYRLDGKISIEVWLSIYKKELFTTLRFPEGKIHEDQATVPLLLYNAERVTTLEDQLYYYFRRSDSIMGATFSEKRFDDIDALNACIRFFEEKGEREIVKLAEYRKMVLWSMYVLQARKAKVYNRFPRKYRMGTLRALRNLETRMSYDKFTWRLNQIYPNLVKPYSYWRKIKQIVQKFGYSEGKL